MLKDNSKLQEKKKKSDNKECECLQKETLILTFTKSLYTNKQFL